MNVPQNSSTPSSDSSAPGGPSGADMTVLLLTDAGPLLIAILLVVTVCALAFVSRPIPDIIGRSLDIVLAFYFGVRAAARMAGARS